MSGRFLILMLSFLSAIGSIEWIAAQDHSDLSGLAQIQSDIKTRRVRSNDRTGHARRVQKLKRLYPVIDV